jgi:hypothetical protein
VRLFVFVAVLGSAAFAASASFAEDCRQYPQGPARFSCVSRNPVLAAKRERCKEEGKNMGLTSLGAKAGQGALPGFVAACMKR